MSMWREKGEGNGKRGGPGQGGRGRERERERKRERERERAQEDKTLVQNLNVHLLLSLVSFPDKGGHCGSRMKGEESGEYRG